MSKVFDDKLEEIQALLEKMASFDFSGTLEIDSDHQIINSVCQGLNWLNEEFEANVVDKSLYTEKIKELEIANKEILTEKKKAEKAVKAKENFLANMSHELRTPMNAVLGFTELLAESDLNNDQRTMVNTINTAGKGLMSILNDILDFSKIESGHFTFESINFNLSEILDNIIQLLKSNAVEKGLKLKLIKDSELPNTLRGDPYRLTQIMMNLVGNAIKFTSIGEVIINVILVNEVDDNYDLKFEISDTGIGIDINQKESIFKSFTQAEKYVTRKYGGTGLGLSISKSLVELQGGSIGVESRLGKGSTFFFRLKFKKPVYKEIEKVASETANIEALRGMKLLIVEDNILNQILINRILSDQGVLVTIANNGLDGVEILQANKDFDVILMDLQMPIMNGYQAVKHIREKLNLEIPIIAMSAHSMLEERDKCLEYGMNDYFPKPFNKKELIRRLEQLV